MLEDLIAEMRRWHEAGETLILAMDLNEDVRKGTICEALEPLGMREIYREAFSDDLPATYNRGSSPIDGIWASSHPDQSARLQRVR